MPETNRKRVIRMRYSWFGVILLIDHTTILEKNKAFKNQYTVQVSLKMKDRIKWKERSPVLAAQNIAERISKEMKGIMSCLNCVIINGLMGLLKFEQ